jgi:hypothetical protein
MAMSRSAYAGLTLLITCSLLVFIVPATVRAQGSISGHIEATDDSSRPDLGAWEYILTMDWNTGSELGLLQFSLYLDDLSRGCSCGQLQSAVTPGDTSGFSLSGKVDCPVYYYCTFDCEGDPDLPVLGKMLTFHPYGDPICQAGSIGTGTFRFYSDFPPVPISASDLYLKDAYESFVGMGAVLGVFPALACDPAGEQPVSWGGLKSIYHE